VSHFLINFQLFLKIRIDFINFQLVLIALGGLF